MKNVENFLKNWWANFKTPDGFFIQLTLALSLIGLLFSFTSSTYESFRMTHNYWSFGLKQLVAFIFGTVLLFLFWKMDYKSLFKFTWPLALIMFVIMLLTVFLGLGKISGGSRRWIDLGIIQFQPAEITKIAVVLLLSRMLTKYKWHELKKLTPYLLMTLLFIAIVLKQPDLGSSIILGLLFLQLVFTFGYPIWILLPTVLLGGLAVSFKILTSYQKDRIFYWLYPYLEPQGRGYNIIQARYAFGIGGLFGSGLGNSIQKQGHLPIPHADFIVAVIAEEIGFLGSTAILLLYIAWILRGMHLISKVQNKYGRILGTAIIFIISTQAVINISVAVGLLPVTGVTLPFFSCGGTSLIVTLIMCGILLSIISKQEA